MSKLMSACVVDALHYFGSSCVQQSGVRTHLGISAVVVRNKHMCGYFTARTYHRATTYITTALRLPLE